MMNLEKMKQKKRTITKSRVKKSLLAATTFLCLTTPLLQTQTAYAAENTTPAMNFERLLLKAKEGNADAVLKILEIYKPLLIKNAIVNGRFDEDLYQELVSTLLQCIQRFQIIE